MANIVSGGRVLNPKSSHCLSVLAIWFFVHLERELFHAGALSFFSKSVFFT